MHPKAIPPALAFLIYRDDFDTLIDSVIFNRHTHYEFFTTDGADDKYGWIGDPVTDTLWWVFRGTDGKDFLNKVESWWTNLQASTSGDGIHDGFQRTVNCAFEKYKSHVYNYKHVHAVGHSQGTKAIYTAVLTAETKVYYKNSQLEDVTFDVYAPPPVGDIIFKQRVDALIKIGLLSGRRYVHPNDPIDADFFRENLGGVDVGTTITLPNMLTYTSKPIIHFVAHSPQLYIMALVKLAIKDKDFKLATDLIKIHDLLIN